MELVTEPQQELSVWLLGVCFQKYAGGWRKENRGRGIEGQIHGQTHSDLPVPFPFWVITSPSANLALFLSSPGERLVSKNGNEKGLN